MEEIYFYLDMNAFQSRHSLYIILVLHWKVHYICNSLERYYLVDI